MTNSTNVQKSFLADLLNDFSNFNQASVNDSIQNIDEFCAFSPNSNDDFLPLLQTNNSVKNSDNSELVAKSDFEKEKEELLKKHQHELEQMALTVRNEEKNNIQQYLELTIATLRADIAKQTADILANFFENKIKEHAISAFVQKLKFSLLCNMSPIIIEGNRDLLKLIIPYIGENSNYKFKETENTELSFKYNDKVWATNIETFLAELKGTHL